MKYIALFALIALATITAAQKPAAVVPPPQPTEAWRRNAPVNFSEEGGQYATDVSGNLYFTYFDSVTPTPHLHLVKQGPAMGVVFNADLGAHAMFAGTHTIVSLSPPILNQQVVYVGLTIYEQSSSSVYLFQYNTQGSPTWSLPYHFTGSGQNARLINMFLDNQGGVKLAMNDFMPNQVGPPTQYFEMVNLDYNQHVLQSNQITNAQFGSADYDTLNNAWLVASQQREHFPGQSYNSEWGEIDPVKGVWAFRHSLPGSYDSATGNYNATAAYVNLLPGQRAGVIVDTWSGNYNQGTAGNYQYFVEAFQTSGPGVFIYPSSGTEPGFEYELDAWDTNQPSPVYIVGAKDHFMSIPHTITAINWSGAFQWLSLNQPVDHLFPVWDGFYTEFENYTGVAYLERAYSNGTYQWGKSYFGTGTNPVARVNGVVFFQDSFYFVADIRSSTSTVKTIDRFVTSFCLQSITGPTTVHSGQQIALSLNFNGPTNGIFVGLNSSSNALLMPNGTRAQGFTVNGPSSLVVNLNAQTVTSNTVVTLLAISNGIRRTFAVTVQP